MKSESIIEVISLVRTLLQEDTLDKFIKLSESLEGLDLLPIEIEKVLLELKEKLQFLITYYSQNQLDEFGLQKSEYSKILSKIEDSLKDVTKVKQEKIEIRDINKIQELSDIIEGILVEAQDNAEDIMSHLRRDKRVLQLIVRKASFNVQLKDQKNKANSVIKELENNFIRKFKTFYDKLTELSKVSFKMYSNILDMPLVSIDKGIIENNEILPITVLLQTKVDEGIRSVEFLEILTGLKSITGNPTTNEVLINLPEKDRPKSLPLSSLFYRYPPFEPISIKRKDSISGNLIWFIKSKNVKFAFKSFLNPPKEQDLLIYGNADLSVDPVKLEYVNPVDLLGGDVNYYLQLTVRRPDDKILYLKYGSMILKNAIIRREDPQEINSKYRGYMESIKRKAYSATNLSYVWYCTWGLGMSTDPWDITCPFKNKCYIGKKIPQDRCPKWSWSRRIHPKVFPAIRREFSGGTLGSQKVLGSILLGIYGRNVLVKERYYGVQMTLPGGNFPIQIEFEKDVGIKLPKTNIIGISINRGVLESIILSIIDPEIPGN